MIVRFGIRNYLSIDNLNMDFTYAGPRAPAGYRTMEIYPFLQAGKLRLAPCMALMGANASGKSNILRAFVTFSNVVLGSVSNNYMPNELHPDNTTTEFTFSCVTKGRHYIYTIAYDSRQIHKETLHCGNKPVYSVSCTKHDLGALSNRDYYSVRRLVKILDTECSDVLEPDNEHVQTRTLLSVLRTNYAGLNRDVQLFYDYLKNIVLLPDTAFPFLLGSALKTFKDVMDLSEQEALNRIAMEVRKFDVTLDGLAFVEVPVSPDDAIVHLTNPGKDGQKIFQKFLCALHTNIHDKRVSFPVQRESNGTQILINVIGFILLALHLGTPIIIDELDKSLHPLITQHIISLFKNKATNPNGAQLIFASHVPDILESGKLGPSEVAFVHKTLKNGTTLTRLSDYPGPHSTDTLREEYLTGAFGAIPFPRM